MSPRDALVESDNNAASGGSDFVSSVGGIVNNGKSGKKGGKIKKLGGVAVVTLVLIIVIVFLFINPIFQIDHISTMLEQSTAAYYTDMTERKATVFAEALREGDVPTTTAKRMKENGATVGYVENGNFVESNQGVAKVAFVGDSINGGKEALVVKVGDEIITADEFYNKYNSNATLYNALNSATYGRAAYYYDDEAYRIFKEIGTSRNEYNSSTDFDEVTSKLMGEGNNISIISAYEKQDCETTETVNQETGNKEKETVCGDKYVYDSEVSGKGKTASELIDEVRDENKADRKNIATMNATDSLAIADEISIEDRSMKFYVAVMQNISKTKAGYGGNGSGHDSILGVFSTLGAITGNSGSNINDVMNMLYETSEVEVVDVNTGETVVTEGSMLQSPSLYAMLTEEKTDSSSVANYSTERILKTVENSVVDDETAKNSAISSSVASNNKNKSGKVWRFFVGDGNESSEDLSNIETTVSSSLTNNSFSTVAGVPGGELLAQGAVNLGAELALASGSTVGDEQAVKKYAKLTSTVLAMDAEVDRNNRNPLDISSKNTFLGSILHKFAVSSLQSGSILNKIASVSRITASSLATLIPNTHADDEITYATYLTYGGECTRYDLIGASGTVGCARNEVFDTSTYDNLFNDEGFLEFRKENLNCDSSSIKCEVKKGSVLEDFVNNNMNRDAPMGVMDSKIIEEETSDNVVSLIVNKVFGKVSEKTRNKASGKEYVNGGENWDKYKYAQAYKSTMRTINALRKYDGDATAYNFYGFSLNDPIADYINEHYPLETTVATNK